MIENRLFLVKLKKKLRYYFLVQSIKLKYIQIVTAIQRSFLHRLYFELILAQMKTLNVKKNTICNFQKYQNIN